MAVALAHRARRPRRDATEWAHRLREAYDAARRAGTPPDWSEPVWLREALTALGARTEIVPPTIAGLTRTEGILGRCWSAEQLPFVITELADAGQVILYFQYWARWRDTHTWTDTPNWELDWTRPWPDLVEASRRAALAAAEAAGTPAGTVATITWMSEDDR